MLRPLALAALLLLAAREPWAPGDHHLEAAEGRAAALLRIPEGGGEGRRIVVALHEAGAAPADAAARLSGLAQRHGAVLLCPRAAGLAFGPGDLPGVLGRAEEVAAALGSENVHLVGFEDGAVAAAEYAFSRPRAFRSVTLVGADAPATRERAPRLWVLVLKGTDDRPRAGRESVVRLANRVGTVDFREIAGAGRNPGAGDLAYLDWFQDGAEGSFEAGVDLAFAWTDGARGLALRKVAARPALVYVTDGAPAFADRTAEIQGGILFDPGLRAASDGFAAIRIPREAVAELLPEARLAAGPALVALDAEGRIVTAQQRRLDAEALLAALTD